MRRALGVYVMAGGFSVGVQQAGFEVVAHLEDGPFGIATAKLNLPEIADHVHPDPASWPLDEFREVDFVFGNPPHADYCVAAMLDVLARLTPSVWVLETWRSPAAREELVNTVVGRGIPGYACSMVLVNERDLGAPDDRKHCFIVLHKVGFAPEMNLQLLAETAIPYSPNWKWLGNESDQRRLDVSPLAGAWIARSVLTALDAGNPLPPQGPPATYDFTEASRPRPPRPAAAVGTPRQSRQGPQPGVEYKPMKLRLPSELAHDGSGPQGSLFSRAEVEPWRVEWEWLRAPQYVKEDLQPVHSIIVHFREWKDFERFQAGDPEAFKTFASYMTGRVSNKIRSVHFPDPPSVERFANKRYVSVTGADVNPRYPIYVISKGRWESRQTSKQLEKLGIPYHIVVEPQEADQYRAVIAPEKVLVLPFSNLGQGSIPARNWVWEHAVASGARRHWILDDNIKGFYRMNWNIKTPAGDGAIFRAAEEIVDSYENVAEAGFNYFMFAPALAEQPPYYQNTRVYSCILLQNDLPFRWRGRYNEDTDLSIRILKAGLCTLLFNAFLADKSTTMTMKGGNTEALYKLQGETVPWPKLDEHDRPIFGPDGEMLLDLTKTTSAGRLRMAEALRDMHPDIVRVSWKWDRWQHHVDYSSFARTKLRRQVAPVTSDLGMVLEEQIGGQWERVKLPEAP